MSISTLAASWTMKIAGGAAARRFEAFTRDALGSQRRKLLELVERNRDTEYGRAFGFASIRGIDDWRRAVPIITYEDIRERVERMTRGEPNVLTAEDPVFFATTSGTTGSPKSVPVTKTCQGRDNSDQMRTWMRHALQDHPSLLDGKIVSLVSRAEEGTTPCGIPCGSTSGQIYKHMPAYIRTLYALPYEVFEIRDYEAKYYVYLRLALGADVSFLATANPTSILKLCETADENADDLLRDLHDGTLKSGLDLPPEIRNALAPHLHAQPDLADDLERALSRRGRLLPADYWPNLALIGCWKGGTVGTYAEHLPEWFDPDGVRPVPVRDWGYLASEARSSVPLQDEGSAGVLSVGANFYEFVPVEEVEAGEGEADDEDRARWTTLDVGQIQEGQQYYVLLTTSGGLYRYHISDVVEVVGRHHDAPIIEFRRKGKGMASLTGEKITENQVIEALERAFSETGHSLGFFQAEADPEELRYVLKVEFKDESGDARAFLDAADKALCSVNVEYESKRASLRLNAPALRVMKPGWHDRQLAALAAAGKRVLQAKVPALLAEPTKDPERDEVVDEVQLEPVGQSSKRGRRRSRNVR